MSTAQTKLPARHRSARRVDRRSRSSVLGQVAPGERGRWRTRDPTISGRPPTGPARRGLRKVATPADANPSRPPPPCRPGTAHSSGQCEDGHNEDGVEAKPQVTTGSADPITGPSYGENHDSWSVREMSAHFGPAVHQPDRQIGAGLQGSCRRRSMRTSDERPSSDPGQCSRSFGVPARAMTCRRTKDVMIASSA
jgi:hypothetical protein